jgi:hypothetical protein
MYLSHPQIIWYPPYEHHFAHFMVSTYFTRQLHSLWAYYYGTAMQHGFLPITVDHHKIDNQFSKPRLANWFTDLKKIIRTRVTLNGNGEHRLHHSRFIVYCALKDVTARPLNHSNCELLLFWLSIAAQPPNLSSWAPTQCW